MTQQLRIAPSGPPAGSQNQPVNIGPGMQIRQVEAGASSGGLTLLTTYQQFETPLDVELDNVKPYYYYSATTQCDAHAIVSTGAAVTIQLRGSYDDFATFFQLAEFTQNVSGTGANGVPDRSVGAHAIQKLGQNLATPVPAAGTSTLRVQVWAKAGVANAVFLVGNQGDPSAWLRLQELAGPSLA